MGGGSAYRGMGRAKAHLPVAFYLASQYILMGKCNTILSA